MPKKREYYQILRQAVGHGALLLPSVAVLLENKEGEILFVYKKKRNVWTFPGGYMEPHETFIETARREVQEELNLSVKITKLLGIIGGPELETTYPNGDIVMPLLIFVKAEAEDISLAKPDGSEVTKIGFFTADNPPSPILPCCVQKLEIIRGERTSLGQHLGTPQPHKNAK
jgi:ADP-ribose pyrophosphatase YjhB (NUDIX family)